MHDAWVHAPMMAQHPLINIWRTQDRPRSYIYPIGCFNAPRDWAGLPVAGSYPGPCLLDHLPSVVRADAQEGRVLLVMDQSQEGNADPQLWSWLHAHAAANGIALHQLVYLTGDQLGPSSYDTWCTQQAIDQRITVIASWFNQHTMLQHLDSCATMAGICDRPLLYNCLNRMPHAHRRQLWMALWQADLLQHGLVSMGAWDTGNPQANALLPQVIDSDHNHNLFNNINVEIYRRTLISVVTETYVDDAQLLIGEKVFKPMLCGSAFMILGSKGTLACLRKQGFRTFDNCWDESYDQMDHTADRIAAIVQQLQLLKARSAVDILSATKAACEWNRTRVAQSWEDSEEFAAMIAPYRRLAL